MDEAALAEALRFGAIATACFDVVAREPPVDTALLALPNFLTTPHIGGSAEAAVVAMGRSAIQGLAGAGDPLALVGR